MISPFVSRTRPSMAQHLTALRGYAKRALLYGEELTPSEAADKAKRMRELFSMLSSLKLTKRDTVLLLYGRLWARKRI